MHEKNGEQARFPWQAFAASLGLHLMALGTLAPHDAVPQAVKAAERPLLATVIAAPVHSGVRDAVLWKPTFSPARPPRPPRLEASPPLALPTPEPTQRELAVEKNAVAEPPLRNESAAPAPHGVASQPTQLAEMDRTGADAAGLRQYRLALASEARQLRRYPEAARRLGWSGTAEVRIVVHAHSGLREAQLHRSSGHAELDAAALEMLRIAAKRTELPASLRGQSFAVVLPVVFEMEK